MKKETPKTFLNSNKSELDWTKIFKVSALAKSLRENKNKKENQESKSPNIKARVEETTTLKPSSITMISQPSEGWFVIIKILK